MKDFNLKLVKIIDHNDQHSTGQVAFLQGPNTCFDLCAVEYENYTREQFTKDAELIVTAVNNFDKMKEALEWAVDLVEESHKEFDTLTSSGVENLAKYKQLLESIK